MGILFFADLLKKVEFKVTCVLGETLLTLYWHTLQGKIFEIFELFSILLTVQRLVPTYNTIVAKNVLLNWKSSVNSLIIFLIKVWISNIKQTSKQQCLDFIAHHFGLCKYISTRFKYRVKFTGIKYEIYYNKLSICRSKTCPGVMKAW